MSSLILISALIAAFLLAAVFNLSRRRRQASVQAQQLDKMMRERPARSAAAIERLLNQISPPVADKEEVASRGQVLAKLILAADEKMQELGMGVKLPFSPESPAASADAISRLRDAELELRRTRLDVNGNAGPLGEYAEGQPLYIAQITRLALEEPYHRVFENPDVYSGAIWAKSVGANGRKEYFLAGLKALDPSGALSSDFSSLHDVLAATGYRLPLTPKEQSSYAALQSG